MVPASAAGRKRRAIDGRQGMAETASDVMVDTLIAWGVDTVFGLPGDGINGIIEAFRLKADRIRFI